MANQNTPSVPEQEQDSNALRQIRLDKLRQRQADGNDPFTITKYDVTAKAASIKADYEVTEAKFKEEAGEDEEALQAKLDTLKEIKRALKKREKKIICVSTQVVEAGVNFSFGCVIRSKAGLDNVIQAAGRCNRHKELGKMGAVYIVQMSDDAEHLEHLREIRDAQAALQKVLHSFDLDEGALDSEAAIKFYYSAYYSQLRELETKYPVEVIAKITEGVSHGAIHVRIRGVNIVVLHLWPHATGSNGYADGNSYRMAEITAFLDGTLKAHPGEVRWLMMGDFNSVSPLDADDLPGGVGLNYDVHTKVLGSGYHDLMRSYRGYFIPSCPTAAFAGGNATRIDFIYGSSAMLSDMTCVETVRDDFTDARSDHYPLMTEFRVYGTKQL